MPIPSSMKRRCLRCDHKWVKRVEEEPVRCARCRSKYWNVPRKTNPVGRPKKQAKGVAR